MADEYNKVIEDTYQYIQNFAEFFAGGTPYVDDLIQETILVVMKLGEDVVMDKHKEGYLKGYTYYVMWRSWRSSSSPFFRNIRRFEYLKVDTAQSSDEMRCDDSERLRILQGAKRLEQKLSKSYHVQPHEETHAQTFDVFKEYQKVCQFLSEEGTPEQLSLFRCVMSEGSVDKAHKIVQEVSPNVNYQAVAGRMRKIKRKIQDDYL